MKLISLINLYKYKFDFVEVYDYFSDGYMYTIEDFTNHLDAYVRKFSVYETDGSMYLQIWI